MATHDPTAENGSVDQLAQLKERDVRALTQYLTVLDDIDRAAGAEDLYLVLSQGGESYLVDAREGACECPDYEFRNVRCKHLRRVAFATGERSIPGWVDRDGVDPDLGEHVASEVRFAVADGGQVVQEGPDDPTTDASDDSRPLDVEGRLAVNRVVTDLLAPELDHLLRDFGAWDATVAIAGESTVRAVVTREEGA